MNEKTEVKLKCLQIAAEASSRTGQYAPSTVMEQAKSWYEWVKERIQETGDRSQNKTLEARKKSSGKSRR